MCEALKGQKEGNKDLNIICLDVEKSCNHHPKYVSAHTRPEWKGKEKRGGEMDGNSPLGEKAIEADRFTSESCFPI